MDEYISIGKTAKILGVTVETLRRWEERGLFSSERTPTGHRRYKLSQVQSFNHEERPLPTHSVFLYARVSTRKQFDAGNLTRQFD